jgi:type III secretion system HrpB4-like protein
MNRDDVDLDVSEAIAIHDRLRCHHVRRSTVFEWAHPDWFDTALLATLQSSDRESDAISLCANHWLDAGSVFCPTLTELSDPVCVLDRLTIDEALMGLRLRALYFRRAELRYWVDRESREQLSEWLGAEAAIAMRGLLGSPHGPPVDRLMRRYQMPPLAMRDAEQLGWEGWCLFARERGLRKHGALALLRLSLPPALDTPNWMKVEDSVFETDSCEKVLAYLHHLFPERTCSSG